MGIPPEDQKLHGLCRQALVNRELQAAYHESKNTCMNGN